jgi:cell wall-associated NlpC family hydrolase
LDSLTKKYFRKFLYCLSIIFIIFITGCSSSLNSERYKTKTEKTDTEKKSPVRFTDENDNENHIKTDEKINDDDLKTTALSEDIDSDENDLDDIPEEHNKVDLSSVSNSILSHNNESTAFSTVKEKMLMEIIRYLNTPYKFGGTTKKGIDCSAFTQTVFNHAVDFQLLRTARGQFTQGIEIDDKNELKFGDLVFFNTRRRVKPGHVGIYIGDNLFAHASSKNGVIVSTLDHNYYSKRFMGARRLEVLSASK